MTPPTRQPDAALVGPYLEHTCAVTVRFHEVDAMRVVWHGWYASYFEDARVALGRRFAISYEDFAGLGLLAPIVQFSCRYLAPARFGDQLLVTARLYPSDAAKLAFTYRLKRTTGDATLALGQSLQVFTTHDGQLALVAPPNVRDLRQRFAAELRHEGA